MNPDSQLPSSALPQGATSTTLSPSLERSLDDALRSLLQERQADRRWRWVKRALWLLFFAALLWILFAPMGKRAKPASIHTALIEVRGEIALGSEVSADAMIEAIKHAFENPTAKAVLLRINSPGGSPVQSGIINDEIKRLKAKHGKKVYAVVEEMCASGAYYIAVAADEIYVDKASLVGSIGVLMDGFGFVDTMKKLGVERRLLTAGDNKGMLDPFSPQNDKHVAHAQSMINQIHQQFIDVVKAGRGDRLKPTADTFSGLFWNGEEAIRMGLADQLGSVDSVARDVIKAEEVVDYTVRDSLPDRLARRFGASLGQSVGDSVLRAARTSSGLR